MKGRDAAVIIEVKTLAHVLPVHEAQIISYLRAAKLRLGYLLNFNVALMKQGIHRRVNGRRS